MRAAVIGVGGMGQHHVRILSQHKHVTSLVICDQHTDTRERLVQRYSVPGFATVEDLLANVPHLDFAVVAVPTANHYEVARTLLGRSVSCLIEKPITSTIAQGEELGSLAARHRVVLGVGHIERYNPAVQALKQSIDDGELGDVRIISTRRAGPGPAPARMGDINVIVDVGIHDIDVFQYLLGRRPVSMHAYGGTARGTGPEDFAILALDYGGTVAQLQVDWISATKVRNLQAVGTRAMAHLEYITQDVRFYGPQDIKVSEDFSEFLIRFGSQNDGRHLDIQPAEPLRVELNSFIDAVRGEGGLLVSSDDAIEALRVAIDATNKIRAQHVR